VAVAVSVIIFRIGWSQTFSVTNTLLSNQYIKQSPLHFNSGHYLYFCTEVKWYFDSIEEIVFVYVRNRLRGTFACACYTLRLVVH